MKELHENTILIVDDTPENIDILVELLEDFDKMVAINGVDALEAAWEEDPPDLVLLDIMMPEMDGYEVCEKLRADERTKDVPVIFLTAKTQKDDIVKGFDVGGQDYITKPFDARELMERVKTQLELKTQREFLKNMNEILEEKVDERTAQLKDAMEKLNKANKELQGLDSAKNNFLLMISHEIRTPLNGIIGASYLLNDMLGEDSEMGEFVDMLKVSVDRLEHFSTTALIITEMQADYKPEREEIELSAIIDEVIEQNEGKANEKNITYDKDYRWEALKVNYEKKLLLRTLNSLFDNAIKYSSDRGKVKVVLDKKDDKTVLEVIDNGSGFSQEALDRLFQPFGLGEQHYDQNVGLSLKACKHIMESHDGSIEVENKDGGGAAVRLIF